MNTTILWTGNAIYDELKCSINYLTNLYEQLNDDMSTVFYFLFTSIYTITYHTHTQSHSHTCINTWFWFRFCIFTHNVYHREYRENNIEMRVLIYSSFFSTQYICYILYIFLCSVSRTPNVWMSHNCRYMMEFTILSCFYFSINFSNGSKSAAKKSEKEIQKDSKRERVRQKRLN